MVAAVRRGLSQREVARRFGVSLSTVQRWVKRTEGARLDRVDWSDHPDRPHRVANRTPHEMETLLIQTRLRLQSQSALGDYGAAAVREALLSESVTSVPSVRTIGRVFERHGLLDARRKVRRQSPPRGWYLPEVACGACEIDSFDIIEGLKIKDGPLVEVFNGISLHGGLVGSWPQEASIKATDVVGYLTEHWRAHGLPAFAQFDNDTLFQGPHQHRDAIGRVIRLCLSLGVTPVFAPVSEHGFQAAIESYNGLWQARVWARFAHSSLGELWDRSSAYVKAHRGRTAKRREGAPMRRAVPEHWVLDLQRHPASYIDARVVFIRRTNAEGSVRLLGHRFDVSASWASRLVRCEVRLSEGLIGFYQLRRRAPEEQPLLGHVRYMLPERPFAE